MRLLTLLTATLLASSALAADVGLPVKPYAVPAAVAVPAWQGFYIGLNAGYGWQNSNNTASYDVFSQSLGTSPSGFIGGGHAGYNFQWGSLVAGVETDLMWSGIKGSAELTGKVDTVPFAVRVSNNLDYLGTVRGRLGYALGSLLLYGTGGLAYGRVSNDYVACIG